ncbi:MAG: hypothetical protein DMF69_05890 [Acidobacteria bacterium]|nr:MAG: hypothetical protein DMF69_05890 [Acidobacteriota bacterium]
MSRSFTAIVCLLGVSFAGMSFTTETQRTQKEHREVENAAALGHFFDALAQTESKRRIEPVRIMHFGDSHVAADVLTREIRERFQNEFGDGGAGFIVPRNPMTTRRRSVVSGATDGWRIDGIGGRSSPDAIYGPAGINLTTNGPGESAWLEASASRFEVYFVREPGGGKIQISVDGVNVADGTILLNSRVTRVDSVFVDLPDTRHRLEVKTLSPGRVRLLGIVSEHLSAGVAYDVFGINGARASRILDWNQAALAAAIKARDPDLIILAYGTNEVADSDWTPDSYELLLKQILRQLHAAAPHASILLFAPPDRADLPLTGRLKSMVSAQRRAAFANNAAFWSAFDAMGGSGSMNNWLRRGLAQPDRVHLTGSGYAKLAEIFYEDLKRTRPNSVGRSSRHEQ